MLNSKTASYCLYTQKERSLTPPSWFVRRLLPSWVAIMSASLVLVAALSVVKMAGMGAKRMKRTRTSDSVAGYMQQRLSSLLEM